MPSSSSLFFISLQPPPWVLEMGLLLALLAKESSFALLSWLAGCGRAAGAYDWRRCFIKMPAAAEVAAAEAMAARSLLDLPELALECILGKLPPAGLAAAGSACTWLRDRCGEDHFWEPHLRAKWGAVLGAAAAREWAAASADIHCRRPAKEAEPMSCAFSLSWIKAWLAGGARAAAAPPPPQAVPAKAWYAALESGRLWFPAQVYNRESGHVGFLMSCYDAHLCYNRLTNTFCARYPPHGQKPVKVEDGVPWSRIRAAPVDTSHHDLHVSDCLEDLRPGDHFEIQWRKNKEFPYGWWYGVVGHQQSCNTNEHVCRCQEEDSVVLEFRHYTPGSRWRRTSIQRKDHREKGNEADGFYGGIRKLRSSQEIAKWKEFWPTEVLD